MSRQVPAEVQKVFDKYTVNFVRRLNRDKAVQMFQEEFKLNEARANVIFDMFDQDRNGLLSIWEFSHFYSSFGYNANEYLDKYSELETESGTADIAKLFDYLSQFTNKEGNPIEGEKVERAIMNIAGEKERSIDQRKFIELICRIKAVAK